MVSEKKFWYELDIEPGENDGLEIQTALARIGIKEYDITGHTLGGFYLGLNRKLDENETESVLSSLRFAGYKEPGLNLSQE